MPRMYVYYVGCTLKNHKASAYTRNVTFGRKGDICEDTPQGVATAASLEQPKREANCSHKQDNGLLPRYRGAPSNRSC